MTVSRDYPENVEKGMRLNNPLFYKMVSYQEQIELCEIIKRQLVSATTILLQGMNLLQEWMKHFFNYVVEKQKVLPGLSEKDHKHSEKII